MKHVLITLCTASLFLGGCATNANQQASSQTENTTAVETNTDQNKHKGLIDSPQAPDDRSLTEVGQTYQDADGSITLKASSDFNEKTTIGDVELTVSDVKVMAYAPSPDLIDFFHGYSNDETKFNYVKIRVHVKNTSDQTVNFAPVSTLETSDGEKKGFDDDFYLENLYGDYAPGEEKIGQLGFVLNTTELEQLDALTIQTSDVFDEKEETITKGQSITVPF
ncbi:DUF4352 domain-containing protein [Guptibacillus hwajinpoensis]|uniref:DUF4352 domain-containing protein n=1 Tax=Guptibacillus hwajinpoensis TaxID=208199 RepID=UPI001CD5416B|nr:DUF4352 domain-containing protein [Pseudalkalibacillus hwajinpoensis]MCA0993734.1 DUF4352 domain-containing protein [Pseudalkalibacillus hwajinpoensis]